MLNPAAPSPFLLTGDHAGIAIPRTLGCLGVSDADRARHIACDIGVREVGMLLAAQLGAVFIHQSYSRLVIDCNRDPGSDDAMPAASDGTVIEANRSLGQAERAERIAAIHAPYHAAIAAEIARREVIGQRTIFVALHSFTPVMAGFVRPWDIGILHGGGDERFACAALNALAAQGGFVVGDNQPYLMDETDHSVPRHAFPRALPYVEVEFRQDHLAGPGGAALWAGRFGDALLAADQGLRSIEGSAGSGAMP